MKQIKKLMIVSLVIIFSCGVVGCTSNETRESTGQYLDNSAITTKVKANLFNHLGTKSFDIKVKSYKDQVQLSGFVDTPMQRHRAEVLTRSVDGVGQVINNIIVK